MGSANHNSGESGEWQMMNFQPMPLLKRAAPFDDPDWIYELKIDGFRALVIIEHGRAQLFASFADRGHRSLYIQYKSDRARWRNRMRRQGVKPTDQGGSPS